MPTLFSDHRLPTDLPTDWPTVDRQNGLGGLRASHQ
jgi:hypothetical protein